MYRRFTIYALRTAPQNQSMMISKTRLMVRVERQTASIKMSWSSKPTGAEGQANCTEEEEGVSLYYLWWEEAAASSSLAHCLLKLRTCISFAFSFGCAKTTGYTLERNIENGCPDIRRTTEAKSMEAVPKWTVAVVPLHHGGRILYRSVNGCYLPWYLRREAEWNRITSDWDWMYPTRNVWWPISVYLFWPTTSYHTAWSKHNHLFVFNLGRSHRGVWCTGNVHNSNCCCNFGHWGVSFFGNWAILCLWWSFIILFSPNTTTMQSISRIGPGQPCPHNTLPLPGSFSQLGHHCRAYCNMQCICWWSSGCRHNKFWPVSPVWIV